MRTVPSCLVAVLAVVPLVAGCTAAKASIQLVNAEQALTRAETQGAPDGAAYEYIMARRYLEKAREEAGYNEYRIADALARQSAAWSDRAVIFIEKRGKTSFDLDDLSQLPEEPAVPPPDVPPPNEGLPGGADDEGTEVGDDDDWLEPSEPIEPLPPPAPEEDEEAEDDEPDPFAIEEAEDELELGEEEE